MGYLVRHIMIDLYGCPFDHLNNTSFVENALVELTDILHTDIRAEIVHQFEPQGVSAMLIVSASHISVHTWPENNYACVDVVVCTDNFEVSDVVNTLHQRFEAQSNNVIEVRRGSVG